MRLSTTEFCLARDLVDEEWQRAMTLTLFEYELPWWTISKGSTEPSAECHGSLLWLRIKKARLREKFGAPNCGGVVVAWRQSALMLLTTLGYAQNYAAFSVASAGESRPPGRVWTNIGHFHCQRLPVGEMCWYAHIHGINGSDCCYEPSKTF